MRILTKVLILGLAAAVAGCSEAEKTTPQSTGTAASPAQKAADQTPQKPASKPTQEAAAVADSDGDGVPDSRDKCTATPAGASTNADGCVPDEDRDGIADVDDACPNSPRSQRVDKTGCPPRLMTARQFATDISFASGSTKVDEAVAMSSLAEPIQLVKAHPNAHASVYAYTDASGPDAVNQRISQQRADAVAEVLTRAAGISAARVRAIGKGEAEPIASNDTASGRQQNRRVVVIVEPGDA